MHHAAKLPYMLTIQKRSIWNKDAVIGVEPFYWSQSQYVSVGDYWNNRPEFLGVSRQLLSFGVTPGIIIDLGAGKKSVRPYGETKKVAQDSEEKTHRGRN